jgi:hypothetical protein
MVWKKFGKSLSKIKTGEKDFLHTLSNDKKTPRACHLATWHFQHTRPEEAKEDIYEGLAKYF